MRVAAFALALAVALVAGCSLLEDTDQDRTSTGGAVMYASAREAATAQEEPTRRILTELFEQFEEPDAGAADRLAQRGGIASCNLGGPTILAWEEVLGVISPDLRGEADRVRAHLDATGWTRREQANSDPALDTVHIKDDAFVRVVQQDDRDQVSITVRSPCFDDDARLIPRS